MIQKKTEQRPWGNFVQYTHNENSTVKIITVEKGEELSLQSHASREEFWKVLGGNPTITIGIETQGAIPGDEFYVSKDTLHRIAAPKDQVTILEISFGNFDENDITRVQDKYGRIKK